MRKTDLILIFGLPILSIAGMILVPDLRPTMIVMIGVGAFIITPVVIAYWIWCFVVSAISEGVKRGNKK